MKAFTFLVIIIVSVSVYAETGTQAGLPFLKSNAKKSARNIANDTLVNNTLSMVANFDSLNRLNSQQKITPSFNESTGAFTRKDKKSKTSNNKLEVSK